jgi:3-isopropylmalate/(R)-2-methylmalate dehydratase small subunit
VISSRFADIFRANALTNGLLPVAVDAEGHAAVAALCAADPGAELTIDLPRQTVTLPSGAELSFPIDPFAKHCLLTGLDPLGVILAERDAIGAFERAHPARVRTA